MKNYFYFIFLTILMIAGINSLEAKPVVCGDDTLADSKMPGPECDTTLQDNVQSTFAVFAKVPIALTSIKGIQRTEGTQEFCRYYSGSEDLGYGTIIKTKNEEHIWITGNNQCNHQKLKQWYERIICAKFTTNKDLGTITIAHYVIPKTLK